MYELAYGLEIVSRGARTKDVNSLQCKFCFAFRKEGQKTAAAASSFT